MVGQHCRTDGEALRPYSAEVQRRALDGITTAEIAVPVHQIVNQPENALLSEQRN